MIKEVSLYIHIPFCKQKCFYCDFNSFSGRETLMDEYIKALCIEIEQHKDKKFRTIFIGGGTPTYLSEKNLKNIGKSIDKLKKSSDLEFTIEGNPGTFTEQKLKIIKEMGVNRLSIGFQAWQNNLLRELGRIHTKQEFVESYNLSRKVGFDNINVDLMFGLPNQTLGEWEETLNKVIEMNPEHLSCYGLIIEEGTPFYNKYQQGKLNLPSEDLERNMYNKTLNILSENGYNQYEISNFALKGKECRHNLVYWDLDDYIGCGAGAHSYIDNCRKENVHSIREYICNINESGNAHISTHKNSKNENIEEFIFMGLRKINGISKCEFKKRFSEEIEVYYKKVLNKFKGNGLLEEENNMIRLSKKGIEISNYILSEFILDNNNE